MKRILFGFSIFGICFSVGAEFTTWNDDASVVAGQPSISSDLLSVSPTQLQVSGAVAVISKHSVSEGKHYFETTTDCGPDTLGYSIGVATSNPLLPSRPYLWTKGWGLLSDGLGILHYTITFPRGFEPTYSGDTFMVALDADNGEVYFGKNGIWLGGANPAVGSNPAFSGLPTDIYAALEVGSRQCSDMMTVTTNFGQNEFKYEVPEGYFKGFCSDGNCSKSGSIEVELAAPELAECSQSNASSIQASAVISENPADPSVLTQWFLDGDSQGYGDNIEITAPLGDSILSVEVTSQAGEIASDSKVITVEDTTPPDIAINFIDRKGNPVQEINRKGLHALKVELGATDVCDPNVVATGTGGIEVTDGADVLVHATRQQVILESSTLQIEASSSDESGNLGRATRTLSIVD